MEHTAATPTDLHTEIATFFITHAPSAKLFTHAASKTSEESRAARKQASGEDVIGAKALLIKLDVKEKPDTFAVVVLPGTNKLDSKSVKQYLRELVAGLRDFRFATAEEMAAHARGVQPGKMPPFGRPFFPDIAYTIIDEALLQHHRIGFNAADFERSIIVDTEEYVGLVPHDATFACSMPPEA